MKEDKSITLLLRRRGRVADVDLGPRKTLALKAMYDGAVYSS